VPMTPTRIGSLGLGSNIVPGRGWGWLTLLHVPGVTEERPGDEWETGRSGKWMLPHPMQKSSRRQRIGFDTVLSTGYM
jgi:hypothetical protein